MKQLDFITHIMIDLVKTQESILDGKNMDLCETSIVGPKCKTLSRLNFYGCDVLLIYVSSYIYIINY